MKHVVIPTHYFTRKWECSAPMTHARCTSWSPLDHVGCGFVYSTSMVEAVFEQLPAHEDVKSTSYWGRD